MHTVFGRMTLQSNGHSRWCLAFGRCALELLIQSTKVEITIAVFNVRFWFPQTEGIDEPSVGVPKIDVHLDPFISHPFSKVNGTKTKWASFSSGSSHTKNEYTPFMDGTTPLSNSTVPLSKSFRK